MRSSSLSRALFAVNPLTVKRALCLSAIIAAGGCKKEDDAGPAVVPDVETPTATAPAAPEEVSDAFRDWNWSAVSQDGTAVLMQSTNAKGECRRSCTDAPAGAELWGADGCIAKRIDLRFVANDCERVVILKQLPEASTNERAWPKSEVAHVYAREKKEYGFEAGGAVKNWRAIRSAGTTFYWLAGALGQPGPKPRYNEDGTAVEFQTLDGAAHSIPLTRK